MTLLPQLEQSLVDRAGGYYGRRRRMARTATRGTAVLAAAATVALVAVFVGNLSSDAELEATPPMATGSLETLADAAGCTLRNPRNEGNAHADRDFTPADYGTNPPTSGNHSPAPAQDGIYDSGPPPLGETVHALEHGRINLQYAADTSEQTVAQLKRLVGENGGYHMLLFENQTGMDAALAATAWGHSLTCKSTDAAGFDAIRAFRDRYIDKGPEQVP